MAAHWPILINDDLSIINNYILRLSIRFLLQNLNIEILNSKTLKPIVATAAGAQTSGGIASDSCFTGCTRGGCRWSSPLLLSPCSSASYRQTSSRQDSVIGAVGLLVRIFLSKEAPIYFFPVRFS